MAQSKQETSSTPVPPPNAPDALGAQVDALLDELDQAADSLQAEADAQSLERASTNSLPEDVSADGSAGGFEQSMFTKPPPAGAPSATKSEARAKDPPLVKASGGPSGKTHTDESLSAAKDAAPKHQEAPIPDEGRTSHATTAPSTGEPEPKKTPSSEIKKLDEHLADTASNHLEEEVESLLSQGPKQSGNPVSPSEPTGSSSSADAVNLETEAPAHSLSQSPTGVESQPDPDAGDSDVEAQTTPQPQPTAPPSQAAARTPSVQPPPAAMSAPATPEGSAAESLSDSRIVVLVGDEPKESRGSGLITKIGVGVLRGISAPLSIAPVSARDAVGYLALVTLFNAAALWILLLLRN